MNRVGLIKQITRGEDKWQLGRFTDVMAGSGMHRNVKIGVNGRSTEKVNRPKQIHSKLFKVLYLL